MGRATHVFLAAAMCDILLEQPCGASATCGRCRVRVVDGAPEPGPAERELLGEAELAAGWRLGCQLVLRQAATVEILSAARSVAAKSFGGDGDVDPSRETVVDLGRAATARPMGLAIDIGTTSLAAGLVRLGDGHVDASRSVLNPQVARGADVLSRIHYASHVEGGRHALTRDVRRGLADIVGELLAETGAGAADVVSAAVVGNPTMIHLWAGLDAESLGRAPYAGVLTGPLVCAAGDVQLPIRPDADVYVLPGIRSHVGADAVAAAVAVGLDRVQGLGVLIDLGTNSEVILGGAAGLWAASTAAGPAFEGATISCGMRAEHGAIDAAMIGPDGDLAIRTIGGGPARGLCGSGLLDVIAELLQAGLIDESGALGSPDEARGRIASALRARFVTVGGIRAVVLAGDTGGIAPPVVLRATDIRQLQLAKGSIRAGLDVLCDEAGVRPPDLERVFVAGTFGACVRKWSLLRTGLLPHLDPERVHIVGNAAGLGARLALLDRRVRARAERVAAETRYVELAGNPVYADAFTQALGFPARQEEP